MVSVVVFRRRRQSHRNYTRRAQIFGLSPSFSCGSSSFLEPAIKSSFGTKCHVWEAAVSLRGQIPVLQSQMSPRCAELLQLQLHMGLWGIANLKLEL